MVSVSCTQFKHFASAKHEQDMHLLIDAIAAAILFRYGTWMRQAVYRAVILFHPSAQNFRTMFRDGFGRG